jgi:hypothetical protein
VSIHTFVFYQFSWDISATKGAFTQSNFPFKFPRTKSDWNHMLQAQIWQSKHLWNSFPIFDRPIKQAWWPAYTVKFVLETGGQVLVLLFCRRMDGVMKCVEWAATGQCSDNTVAFLKSTNQEQYAIICSAPKMVVNVILLCMLYLLNRLLLF